MMQLILKHPNFSDFWRTSKPKVLHHPTSSKLQLINLFWSQRPISQTGIHLLCNRRKQEQVDSSSSCWPQHWTVPGCKSSTSISPQWISSSLVRNTNHAEMEQLFEATRFLQSSFPQTSWSLRHQSAALWNQPQTQIETNICVQTKRKPCWSTPIPPGESATKIPTCTTKCAQSSLDWNRTNPRNLQQAAFCPQIERSVDPRSSDSNSYCFVFLLCFFSSGNEAPDLQCYV